MAKEDDPFDTFSSETMKRAEEMCAGLSLNMTLERRGHSKLYHGAVTDLDDPKKRNISVTVAEVDNQPYFTLVSDRPLTACRNALLVYRVPPSQDMKYVGKHGDSEPGKRGEEDQSRQVVRFNILRDVRQR